VLATRPRAMRVLQRGGGAGVWRRFRGFGGKAGRRAEARRQRRRRAAALQRPYLPPPILSFGRTRYPPRRGARERSRPKPGCTTRAPLTRTKPWHSARRISWPRWLILNFA